MVEISLYRRTLVRQCYGRNLNGLYLSAFDPLATAKLCVFLHLRFGGEYCLNTNNRQYIRTNLKRHPFCPLHFIKGDKKPSKQIDKMWGFRVVLFCNLKREDANPTTSLAPVLVNWWFGFGSPIILDERKQAGIYVGIVKVTKFQKQFFLFSFEPKNERNYFFAFFPRL